MSADLALAGSPYTWDGNYQLPMAKPRKRVTTPIIRRISVDVAIVVQATELAAYYSAAVATAVPVRASAKEAGMMSEAELREVVYRYTRRGVQFIAIGMFTISALAAVGHLPGWDALAYGLGGFVMMGWSFLISPQSSLAKVISSRRLQT